MGKTHQMAMPIALGRSELAATAAGIANRLQRPQAPLPSAGEFPDPVVEPSGAQVTTEQAIALGEAHADALLAAQAPRQAPAQAPKRRKFTADKVAVFCRVLEVRDQNGLVQIAPVTPHRAKGGGLIWLMVQRQTLERAGYFVPGSPSGPACVHPLVKGAGLMVRFTKNRVVLELRAATPQETTTAPANDGGGRA